MFNYVSVMLEKHITFTIFYFFLQHYRRVSVQTGYFTGYFTITIYYYFIITTNTIINICWFNNTIFQYFAWYIFLLDMKQTDFSHIFMWTGFCWITICPTLLAVSSMDGKIFPHMGVYPTCPFQFFIHQAMTIQEPIDQ